MPFQLSPILQNLRLSVVMSQEVFVACPLQQVHDLCRTFLDIAERSINAGKAESHLLSPNHFHL